MSQQSLASKTITKRNVAQSSVIFSVVVAVITLGVIVSVAYLDISENIDSVAVKKSIPDLIAEQRIRSDEFQRQTELLSQAEDLVLTLDQRVDDLKQLDEKVKLVNDQLNFISTNLQATPGAVVTPQAQTKSAINMVKTVQQIPSNPINSPIVNNKGSKSYQQYLNSVFSQNNAAQMSTAHQMSANGEGYLEFSWLFKGRGSMSQSQRMDLQHYLKSQQNNQTAWNAKSL